MIRSWLFAALYDQVTASAEPMLAPLRARTARQARGRVLEIGAGTGANLAWYPADARLTLAEPCRHMAARLRLRASATSRDVRLIEVPAERLPFDADSFDTVVATLVLCSVREQQAVLAELRRVLRPGGEFRFLEHVAALDPAVRAWQHRLSPLTRWAIGGCTLDRQTGATIERAGFASMELERVILAGAPAVSRELIVGHAVV